MTISDENTGEIPDPKTWLKNQNFERHPFEQLVADSDKDLEEYFQQFPFFEVIEEPNCTFLFLERGAGKSANRVYLQRRCDKSLKGNQDSKLSVAYTDFHRLIRKEQVTLADHVDEILREAVPRLFDVAIQTRRGELIKGLPDEYGKDFAWFVTHYIVSPTTLKYLPSVWQRFRLSFDGSLRGNCPTT